MEMISDAFNLSPQQRRLWALQQSRYDLPFRAWCAVEIEGPVDPASFERALAAVAARHEILRTTLKRAAALQLPVQVVGAEAAPQLVIEDLTALSTGDQEAGLERVAYQLMTRPLDCEEGPTLSAALLRRSPQRSLLILHLPGLCADWHTLRNLVREIADHLAPAQGETEETVQYADFAAWQNELLGATDAEEGRRFWQTHESRSSFAAGLPSPLAPQESPPFVPRSLSVPVAPATTAALSALAARLETGLPTVVLAAWQAVLWRLDGGSQITVAAAYAGRRHEELDGAFGLYARYLPVSCRPTAGTPFGELAQQTARAVAALEDWQEYFTWDLYVGPAEKAQSFAFGFDAQNLGSTYGSGGVRLSLIDGDACVERFQMRLSCRFRGDRLELALHYDASLSEAETAACLLDQIQTLMASGLEQPSAGLGKRDDEPCLEAADVGGLVRHRGRPRRRPLPA